MKNPPYLQKYSGRSSRFECPRCHDKHSLTRYLDGESHAVIHPSVGRCDHESSCGYHYTPKQYFQDNNPAGTTQEPKRKFESRRTIPARQTAPDFIPKSNLIRSIGFQSNFVRFLCSIFDPETLDSPTIKSIVENYYLGQTRDGRVIYWQVDVNRRIRTGKIMQYDPLTGKRIKKASGAIDWVHSILKKDGVLPDSFNLEQCLFGEHLLNKYPDHIVGLVEGEKSAVIASGMFPEYIWLATGGKSQLSPKKMQVLKGRTVIMFPDSDAFDYWTQKARELEALGIDIIVSTLIQEKAGQSDRKDQIDIADWMVGELKGRIGAEYPETTVGPPVNDKADSIYQSMLRQNPHLNGFITALGLECTSQQAIV